MKKVYWLCVAGLTFLTGCVTMRPPTVNEAAYERQMVQAWSKTQDQSIPNSDAQKVWGRVQSFVGRYSDTPVRVATDTLIETIGPGPRQIGFSIVRIPAGDSFKLRANCMWGGNVLIQDIMVQRCVVNLAALRYYAMTGEEPPSTLVQENVSLSVDTATVQGAGTPAPTPDSNSSISHFGNW